MADPTQREYSDLPETYVSQHDFPEPYAAPNEALEVVHGNEGKEVHGNEQKEVARSREDDAPERYDEHKLLSNEASEADIKRRKRKRLWLLAAASLIVGIAIALGVGLGVGLRQKYGSSSGKPDPADTAATSSANPWLSKRGVFNGSDISVTEQVRLSRDGQLQPVTSTNNSEAMLIYQHYTGEIRWMYFRQPDYWYGGTTNEVLIKDAKNSTPLDTTVSRVHGEGHSELHVFYVDRNNMAKEIFVRENSSAWNDGPLNDLKYTMLDDPRATLRVGRYSGPTSDPSNSDDTPNACAKLFISSHQMIDELNQCPGGAWLEAKIWPDVDARSPPAYRGWTMGDTVLYAAFVDRSGGVNLYWLDTNANGSSQTDTHRLNVWFQASKVIIPNVEPSAGLSDLSDAGVLVGRAANNGPITNWNVYLNAEHSTVSPSWTFDPPQYPMLPGSKLKATSSLKDFDKLYVYYQSNGDDIVMAIGSIAQGPTDPVAWPIPDE